jgi:HEPN/RES N-terminal domain 1/RES domain
MGLSKRQLFESMRRGHAARDLYVCGACLRDDALAEFANLNATSTKCEFCGTDLDEPHAASLGDVIEHMEKCISKAYADPADELFYETREGGWQGRVLDAWELMGEVEFHVESEELFDTVVASFNDQDWCDRDYYRCTKAEKLRFGWDAFKMTVKHERRFTFSSIQKRETEFDEDDIPVGKMLAAVCDCIRDAELIKVVPKGKNIWRVRVHAAGLTLSEDHELGPPPLEKAQQANRMSPSGVVMFYGAEDFETACAETVDPDRASGKRVTGVQFHSVRELRLLDLVDLPEVPSLFHLGLFDHRNTLIFLRHFATDLAAPVGRDGREHIEYVPTQAFSEFVRYELRADDGSPIHGIRYRSAANERTCYVLFCTRDECVSRHSQPRKAERWLEFDRESIRTIDAQ